MLLKYKACACPRTDVLWSVVSDGRRPKALVSSLRGQGRRVSEWAEDILFKPGFRTSRGVMYRVAGIRGNEFRNDKRTTRNIFMEAWRRRLVTFRLNHTPPLEVAPLLREMPQDELGCPVAVFHKPVLGSGGYPNLLVLYADHMGAWLDAWLAFPDTRWPGEFVFAFLAPDDAGRES